MARSIPSFPLLRPSPPLTVVLANSNPTRAHLHTTPHTLASSASPVSPPSPTSDSVTPTSTSQSRLVPTAGVLADQSIAVEDGQQLQEMHAMDYDTLASFLEDKRPKKRKSSMRSPTSNKPLFKDRMRLRVAAGNGGAGLVSFYRGPRERSGPPDGGDGGRGGDVIVRAVAMEPNLRRLKHFYRAVHGRSGSKNNRAGKNGGSVFVDVPIGTVITQYTPPVKIDDAMEAEDLGFIPYYMQNLGPDGFMEKLGPDEDEDGSGKKKKRKSKNRKKGEEEDFEDEEEDLPEPDYVSSGPGTEGGGEVDELFLRTAKKFNKNYKAQPSTSDWKKEVVGGEELTFDEEGVIRERKPYKSEGVVGKSVDLDEEGAFIVVARGGLGGNGNRRHAHGGNRTPKTAGKGTEGETCMFNVELKLIAQIGLVGFPNAGKSSFLTSISNATPKIANYPFTTLTPNLGTIQFKDSYSYTIADLPGLIEGAHENRGMGHEFLRHIERTKVICYVIDMAGTDSRDPWEDYSILREELKEYNPEMIQRRSIILANKMDLPQAAANLKKFKAHLERLDHAPSLLPISAQDADGVGKVAEELREELEELDEDQDDEMLGEGTNRIRAHEVKGLGQQLEKFFEE
eukprot:TRINITY_DN67_c0_g1_i1.p1 TRINITY_DN67_c0_g1~~TRINITY_DN67_c0_g1_i1.p1  ORF type:complete len:639 (+),score=191.41 TRINITY_DN67_c0_g1_i1:43-1917(+)